ncbi:MAG TPA: tetratricopeptide repeat protein [Longimicrobiales bacterium]|nr:tetratricopeptide repeat protein [Longimicrobiales bacterium]
MAATAQTALAVSDEEGNPLGEVALRPVPCSTPASELLRVGLALLHNMTYEGARARFTEAVVTDPDCLLGYWGAAMSYIHPLWPDRPTDEDLAAGSRILATANSRRAPTAFEAALLGAVHEYYRDAPERTEAQRLEAFRVGWEEAARRFPGDPEIRLFHALSLLVAAQGSADMMELHERAGEMAQEVLRMVPRHPGALHYTIHAFDLPELAERGEPAARAYGEVIPENAHALHMTSHIFTRLGAWEESVAYNGRATEASLRPPLDGLSLPNFFHAADYLVYALLQRGESASARALHDQLRELEGDLPQPLHPAAAYTLAAVPARLALERQAWVEASRLAPRPSVSIPWDRFPHLEAIPTFAAGLGAARSGDVDAAEAALTQLSRLRERAAEVADPFDWGTQVRIQELALEAWILFEGGDSQEGLQRMREAAYLEEGNEKHGVSPGNVLPAAELYGDMQMEVGQHAEALIAYENALERSPNRLNSLYGAGRAAEALGDTDTARTYYRRLMRQASESADFDRVRHAADFLRDG